MAVRVEAKALLRADDVRLAMRAGEASCCEALAPSWEPASRVRARVDDIAPMALKLWFWRRMGWMLEVQRVVEGDVVCRLQATGVYAMHTLRLEEVRIGKYVRTQVCT